ncbi:MAG: tetratricopeptide repeat protein [Desulfohalobiaceae bacterium]|nr:tetratricopeptide repeat protein [Desulfohalobiaceae bacterium]
MAQAQVKIISTPKDGNGQAAVRKRQEQQSRGDNFLEELAGSTQANTQLKTRLRSCLGEVDLLKSRKAWSDVLELFYPLQDKQPELVAAGLDLDLRLEIGFALGQLGKFDQAVSEYEECLRIDPQSYLAVNSLAYTLYNSLFAAKNREILLTPEARKQRIERAHREFQKAQAIRPDGVTNYYREGMLFKSLENKPDKALDLFARAVGNWDAYSPEQKEARHQERKNFIKALYNLASCQSGSKDPKAAWQNLKRCVLEDGQGNNLKMEHKYFALGKVCFQLGHYEEGVKHLKMAAQFVSPVEGDYVFELLARTRHAQGRYEQGLEIIGKIPKNKRRPYVHWTEADLLLGLGKPDQAREVLINSSQRDKRARHRSLVRLARIAFQEKVYEQSLDYADQAVEFHRETYTTPDPDGLFWQAASCLYLGDIAKARQKSDELMAFNPNFPYLRKLRDKIHQAEEAG